jgi:autotransporter passenger strand-loop-strand repeat protein
VVDQPGAGISVYTSVVTGVSLSSGGTELVLTGGTAVSTTVANGSVLVSGGTVSDTDAALYGRISVGSGGDAVDTTLALVSELVVVSGGSASNVSLTGNLSELFIGNGGTVTGTIDFAPDALGGVVASSSAYASGSFVAVDDGAGGTEIGFFGADSYLLSSGVTSHHLAIAGGGYLDITSGGTSISATLSGSAPLLTYAALVWEASGCAELIVTGPHLDTVRRHLADRAEAIAALERAA